MLKILSRRLEGCFRLFNSNSKECSLADDRSDFEDITFKFRNLVIDKLASLDTAEVDELIPNEQHLKSYLGFFKLLQCLEEMIIRGQQERDAESERGVDILEFRRQLEEEIAKLVDIKNEATLS